MAPTLPEPGVPTIAAAPRFARRRAAVAAYDAGVRATIVLCLIAGCASDPAPTLPEVDCAPPVPAFGDVLAFRTNCVSCHSIQLSGSSRRGAPVGMDYDVYASAAAIAEPTARTVFLGTMPPTGGILPADKDVLYRWALCGAPP